MLRRNVVTSTRNYNRRLKAFIKEIITDPSNPMSVDYYSLKLEFQGRGAGHNYGTLRVNMEKMEFMLKSENKLDNLNPVEYDINSFDKFFGKHENKIKEEVKKAILICINDEHPKNEIETMKEDMAKKNFFILESKI